MSNLTIKQENFCLAYIETGNASESYRGAYSCEKMSDKTVNEASSRSLSDSKIAARIKELRAPVIEKAQITLEQHLRDLKTLRDKADSSEKYGPAIQAEIARGKASGLYVEKTEVTGPNGGAQQHDVNIKLTAEESYLRMIGKS